MKKILVLSFLATLNLCSCKRVSNSCEKLPQVFISYRDAKEKIKDSEFNLQDSFSPINSSWIQKAVFYSCDREVGYLLVTIKGEEYIYQNVPLSVWLNFKKATSSGAFYNKSIKKRYLLNLKN